MNTSEQINELAAALAKAQAIMAKAAKDSTNPHFRSKYADLASVSDACREALTGNGIAVLQGPSTTDDGAVVVTTRLIHSSGQWAETAMACRPMKADAQAMGSVVTYLRRYCLAAMAGVAPDDDDGNAASGIGAPAAPQSSPQPRTAPKSPPKAPTAANGKAAAGEPATAKTPVDWENGDAIPFGEPVDVEYVNTGGAIETVPLEIGIRKLRAAHKAPEDKLSNADWFKLYENNAAWLEQHAPAVATELATRNG